MPSAWGEALMALGRGLPAVGQSVDTYNQNKWLKSWEEQEAERKAKEQEMRLKTQDLENRMLSEKLGEVQYQKGEREKAEKNFFEYLQDARDAKNIPQLAAEGPTQQHDRLVRLEEMEKMQPSEQLSEYGLIGGAEYSPKVNSYVSNVLGNEQAKKKAESQLALANLGYQQDADMLKLKSQLGSEEERRKEAARMALEREKLSSKEKLAEMKKKDDALDPDKIEFKNALIDQLKTVMNHPAKYSGLSVGRVASILPTESRDFKQQMQKLKSMTTLENLKYLKGAMSDKDVKFIQEASSALDLGGSLEALDRELNKMYKSATSSFPGNSQSSMNQSIGVTTPQTQAEYDALPSGAIYIDPDDGKRYRKP